MRSNELVNVVENDVVVELKLYYPAPLIHRVSTNSWSINMEGAMLESITQRLHVLLIILR